MKAPGAAFVESRPELARPVDRRCEGRQPRPGRRKVETAKKERERGDEGQDRKGGKRHAVRRSDRTSAVPEAGTVPWRGSLCLPASGLARVLTRPRGTL